MIGFTVTVDTNESTGMMVKGQSREKLIQSGATAHVDVGQRAHFLIEHPERKQEPVATTDLIRLCRTGGEQLAHRVRSIQHEGDEEIGGIPVGGSGGEIRIMLSQRVIGLGQQQVVRAGEHQHRNALGLRRDRHQAQHGGFVGHASRDSTVERSPLVERRRKFPEAPLQFVHGRIVGACVWGMAAK